MARHPLKAKEKERRSPLGEHSGLFVTFGGYTLNLPRTAKGMTAAILTSHKVSKCSIRVNEQGLVVRVRASRQVMEDLEKCRESFAKAFNVPAEDVRIMTM